MIAREGSLMRQVLKVPAVILFLASFLLAQASNQPTTADVEKFLSDAEARLDDLALKASRAAWVQATYKTDDTEAMAAAANENCLAADSELARQAQRHGGVQLEPKMSRKHKLLKRLV